MGIERNSVLLASAKEGIGISEMLVSVVERVPAPVGSSEDPLRALIFDSYYDKYLGAVPSVRVVDGVVKPGMSITFGNVGFVHRIHTAWLTSKST